MKKIIINGGEFYRLYEVYNETKNFVANQQTALVDVEAGQIYRVEVNNTTDRFSLYNGVYLAPNNYGGLYIENGKVIYTVRAYQDGPLYLRYVNGASNVTVKIYKVSKYGKMRFIVNQTGAQEVYGPAQYYIYLQPIPVSGKTYHIEIEVQYNGRFALYGSDNTELIQSTDVVVGDKFTYDYTAIANGGYFKVRAFESGVDMDIMVNEVQ